MTSVHHTSAKYGSGSDGWRTPLALFDKLNGVYRFNADAAASKESTLLPSWFGPDHDDPSRRDALKVRWNGSLYLNPPYSKLREFLAKAALEVAVGGGFTSVTMLVPARTDTKAWHEIIMMHATDVHFIKGRLCFQGASNSAPFPSAIVRFADIRCHPDGPHFYSMERP